MAAKAERKSEDKSKLTAREQQIQLALAAGGAAGAREVKVPPPIVRRKVLKQIQGVIAKAEG